ncbi:MAG: acyl--CoA ligase [Pseudomonadales bacterium]|nr:acyl--CoA ligase [Pseudomonadales bacterium]
MSIEAVHAALTAPGAPFEMETQEIRGVSMRVWKHAPRNLAEIFVATTAFADRTYLVYEDEHLTYGQVHEYVARLARLLVTEYGVQKGDRVAIAMRNFPEWPICFWAAAMVGAVVVPLNAWWTGHELEYGLSDSGARVLIADEQRAHSLVDFYDKLALTAVLAVRSESILPDHVKGFHAELARMPAGLNLPEVDIDPEDEATIFYTSGTTGQPKGALGTHRNICTNLLNVRFAGMRALLRKGEDVPALRGELPATPPPQLAPLLSVPFFHATGCHSTLVANTAAGNKLVMMYKWDAERAMALIEREKITSFGGVPSMAWQVLESPDFDQYDLSTIQSIGYGGAPAAPELVTRIKERFPQVSAGNGYGLTETSSMVTSNSGVDYERKPNAVGVPMAINDVRLMNADGTAEVAKGEVGELWIKGPNVIKAYWNKPEATAATITDGWLHSGDLARIDEEGFVYIVDRAKDMLIRGGENIYCVEVENALYEHPDVMDCTVVGVPHKILGEEVGTVIQLVPGAKTTPEDLQAFLRNELAAFMIPQHFLLRSEPLERNANGKILKPEAKKQLLDSLGIAAD